MSDSSEQVDIPKRALFKAAEVCELVKLQPYVLRSWESEFPELGIAKAPGGPRVYRRSDVEQVLRIKHLLLVDGLTLAGARRRLEEEATPVGADVSLDELIGQNARDRLTEVKRGLRAILELLTAANGEEAARASARLAAMPRAPSHGSRRPSRGKNRPSRERPVSRRKRSAS